jgi:thioester reductase-like protein
MSNLAIPHDRVVLLTGVTGSLGSELLPRLLRRFPNHGILALIRSRNGDATDRLDEVMRFAGLSIQDRLRVGAIPGDTTLPNLGLSAKDLKVMAARTSAVFHTAASVAFDRSLAEMRAANVVGTREILGFARRAAQIHGDFRLHYVSTAYVVGDRRGLLRESELDCGQGFWNSYEQSKMESERLVMQAMGDAPATIYRPSHIIGNVKTGKIRRFFGIYGFIRLAHRLIKYGNLDKAPKFLIADPDTRGDMVPCDYVCDAMVALAGRDDTVGGTYHLTAGLDASLPISKVVEITAEIFESALPDKAIPRPPIFKSDIYQSRIDRSELRIYQSSAAKLLMGVYLPYLSYERDFDVRATKFLLALSGVFLPPIEDVLRDSIRYAIRQGFGDYAAESEPLEALPSLPIGQGRVR